METPKADAAAAKIAEIPPEKVPEKKQSVRDGLLFITFAVAGLASVFRYMNPPPVTLVFALFAVGLFGAYNMSKEMTRIQAAEFIAKLGDAADRITGRKGRP